jgi:hypothetical protein
MPSQLIMLCSERIHIRNFAAQKYQGEEDYLR